jgi:hypothetical protein
VNDRDCPRSHLRTFIDRRCRLGRRYHLDLAARFGVPTVQVCAAASSARSLLDLVLIDRAPVDDLPGRDRRRQVPSRRIDVHGLELADLKTIGDDGVNVRIYGPGSRWKGDNHGSADRRARAQRDGGAGRRVEPAGDSGWRRAVARRGPDHLRMARGHLRMARGRPASARAFGREMPEAPNGICVYGRHAANRTGNSIEGRWE